MTAMKALYPLAMVAMISLPCATAGAQDLAAQAQSRFSEGVVAYDKHDFERARLLFLQSEALVSRGSTLRNLGLAEMQLGKTVDALHHLRAALRLPDLDQTRRTVTQNDARDAYAATGHVVIDTVEGAQLTIDGQAVDGKAPFLEPIDVMPGSHVLEASLDERKSQTTVDAKAGVLVSAALPMEPAPSAAVSPAPAPVVDQAQVPEAHGFWNARRGAGLGIAVAGAASVAAGVFFYSQAVDAESRANAARVGLAPWSCTGALQPQACVTANDAWSSQSTDAVLNYAFLGVGGAAIAIGGAMFLWPSSHSVVITPAVTSGGAGLHVGGSF